MYFIIAITFLGPFALLLLGFILISHAIMLGSIRGNGVRISERQFPDVYERAVELSSQMNLEKVPDIFVIHSEGAFNAFATRFFGRNMVVIYSEVFELAREKGEKELDFIIAHELAHIKRRHILKNLLVLPSRFVPFLSQAYSRACEYTCDRKAAYYIQDGQASKNALTMLGIGKALYHEVNEESYLEQIYSESNVAVWFAEVLSTHPVLPKRIQAVGQFMRVEGTPNIQPNNSKIAIGAILSFLGISVVYGSVIAILVIGSMFLSKIIPEHGLIPIYGESESNEDGTTPLMQAVMDGNYRQVEQLLNEGVDIHETDFELTTALHYAVYFDEVDIAHLLLMRGANANDSDFYSNALTAALNNESYYLASILLSYKADPSMKDPNGHSGLSYFGVNTAEEFEWSLISANSR